ncbi:MAG: amidohydrolase family protein [Planctomycetota bacterium]
MDRAYEELYEFVSALAVIDTHEHLPSSEDRRDKDTDVLKEYLQHYLSSDLVSAGLPKEDLERVRRMDDDIKTKWSLVATYWERARNTGYARAVDIAVQKLYGIARIDGETIQALDGRFRATLAGGWYRKVLKETCRIRTSLLDNDAGACDREYFTPVYRPPLYPSQAKDLETIGKEIGGRAIALEDWKRAVRARIEKEMAQGAAAIKIACAYERPLSFENVPSARAEEEWNALFRRENLVERELSTRPSKALQDHLVQSILAAADEMHLVVQVHTGIQEGNGNMLDNSDPIGLCDVFLRYPNATFDIFHMSYPFQHKLSALAKMFPNVHIDMCWAHIISPEVSARALGEFLDAVPASKISAFGGDYAFVDGVVGHLEIARRNVARALAEKVHLDVFDMDRAKEIATMLFHDNPARIFQVKTRVKAERRGKGKR